MPSKSPVKKQKPLQLDCTALFNHLSLVQRSIPYNIHMDSQQYQRRMRQPNLQMINFTKGSLPRTTNSYEWYILVASTPFAISAQLVPVPKSRDTIVQPDLIQCTPISIWTCSQNEEISQATTSHSNSGNGENYQNDNTEEAKEQNKIEILTNHPVILIQESFRADGSSYQHEKSYGASGESLSVSVVLGTTHSRVLCVQLSIFSYVGASGREEGRYVLSKAVESSEHSIQRGGILEPLPLDSDDMLRRKMGDSNSSRSNYNHSSMSLSSSHNNDGHSMTSGTNYTAGSRDTTRDSPKWVPFHPKGGVSSISPLYKCRNNKIVTKESKPGSSGDFVWISYNDGTLVRLPRWAFFPLLDDDYDDVDNDLDNKLQVGGGLKDRLVKAMVIVNSKSDQHLEEMGLSVVPLPKFFPSMMSQPLQTLGITPKQPPSHGNQEYRDEDSDVHSNSVISMAAPAAADYEFYEAVSFQRQKAENDKDISAPYPTMSFYTNEDQLFSKTHSNISDDSGDVSTTVQSIIRGGSSLIGGTAALAKGVIGGMFGAVLGRSKQSEEESMKGMEIIGEGYGDNSAAISAAAMFPPMHEDSIKLPLGAAIFDMPRQIQDVSIDPVDGALMACSDNLGRVQLVDLTTKQVIRLWKGMRDASCHWIQFPFDFETGAQIVKYLTIHCRERKVIEIFRMRHGTRVGKFATTSDAQIVQCVVALKGDESYTKCFVLQTNNSSKKWVAKELMVHDAELNDVILEAKSSSSRSIAAKNQKYLANHQSLSEGTIQLQLLKQLLATESAVPSDLEAIYAALTQITAISDLSKALDVLAVSQLELIGVQDSSFHVDAIAHSTEQLDFAMSDQIVATSNNPHLEELRNKIDFHNQLVASFNILHQFETKNYSDNDVDEMTTKSRSSWVVEAMSWIETNEEVCGSIDSDLPTMESNLTFPTWSKGFLQDQGSSTFPRNNCGDPILYLCDSTRDRKNILLHIFKPLTKDIFIFKTTNQIFECMGIHKDYEKLLQYYGEWFMSLPKDILTKECLGIWCPTVRWLLDVVHDSYDKSAVQQQQLQQQQQTQQQQQQSIILYRLYKFCEDSSDLPRAFLLASICRDAVHSAAKQLEEKTYGNLSSEASLRPWEELLRKLRVCQMIRLRLYGEVLGAFPITVGNVDKGKFSIYEWIARDLLKFSHSQKELASLEIASITSTSSFFPSSLEGDEPSRRQAIQECCKKKVLVGQPSETLLHYMNHFGHLKKIATHRALLLSREWGKNPENLELLQDAFASLQNIGKDDNKYSALLASALLEIWQVHIRPIYRAILYGFEEVHEVCEEIIAPLCLDPDWVQSLNKMSMKILMVLLSAIDSEPYSEELGEPLECNMKGQWPKINSDMIIEGLMQTPIALEESSLETHYGILCAIHLNDDLSLLPMCVNSFESLFMRESFSLQFSRSFTANEYQLSFVESSIKRLGELAEGPNVGREYLDDIVALGRSWGLEKSNILTQFLLAMYELGKDDLIEDLFNSITRLVDVDMFLDNGIAIVCVRLSAALSFLKKVKRCRSMLAMLDADTCEWVREQARVTRTENPGILVFDDAGNLISLDSTLSLILRMKRMSAVNRIDAYALSVMCETLMKAMEFLERS